MKPSLLDRILLINDRKKSTFKILDVGDRCPWCKEIGRRRKLVLRRGHSELFIGCSGFPECSFTTMYKLNQKEYY